MTRFLTLALCLLVTGGIAAQDAAATKALAPFQGTWVLSGPNGEEMIPGGELALIITGDKYAQSVNGEINERGSMKIDFAKKPMTLDLIITEGADAGKTQLGLIEIKGDTMMGVLNAPADTNRPTALSAEGGLIYFHAKKKAK
jgi:uncharacterized protein (TIGR03067 family)